MPTNDLSVQELLGYVPLTEPVKKIVTDLPRVLPEAFYKNTKQVIGDRFKRIATRGTRKVSKISPYGSPPKQRQRTGVGVEEAVMIHSVESISAGREVLNAFIAHDNFGTPVLNAANELARQAEDFASLSDNLRTTSIHSLAAFGKLWFDADGNIQMSSSGADLEIDYRIPSANRTAFGTSWSDANADIPTMVLNLQTQSMQATGRRLKYCFYGRNVAGYLANNTKFREYLARTYGTDGAAFRDRYIRTGTIPDGVLDLIWVKAQDAFFENDGGTITEIFPDDQTTFWPEVSDVYCLREGSMLVPKQFAMLASGGDMTTVLKNNTENAYGMFRYAYGQFVPTIQIHMVQGDTFFPDLYVPEAVFIKDTTP
jgi:hypothetical protein